MHEENEEFDAFIALEFSLITRVASAGYSTTVTNDSVTYKHADIQNTDIQTTYVIPSYKSCMWWISINLKLTNLFLSRGHVGQWRIKTAYELSFWTHSNAGQSTVYFLSQHNTLAF